MTIKSFGGEAHGDNRSLICRLPKKFLRVSQGLPVRWFSISATGNARRIFASIFSHLLDLLPLQLCSLSLLRYTSASRVFIKLPTVKFVASMLSLQALRRMATSSSGASRRWISQSRILLEKKTVVVPSMGDSITEVSRIY
jgi:hypothetical protein